MAFMTTQDCKSKIDRILNKQSKTFNDVEQKSDKCISDLKELMLQFAQSNYRKSSNRALNTIFNDLIKVIGNKSLNEVTVLDVERFKSEKSKNGALSSTNLSLRFLKASFNKAINWNLTQTNPFTKVKQFKIPEKKKQFIQDHEIKLLLDNCTHPVLKNIIFLGIYTGMRQEEILNSKWEDVNFNDGFITIKNTSNFRTKSGKIRNVVIVPELKDMLLSIKSINDKPCDLIFKDENGNKMSACWMSHLFKRLVRQLNLPEQYHFHSMRHTFASTLIKNNVPLPYVQSLLGHADIQTTINSYTHIIPEHLKQSVNSIKMYSNI
jgi:integrase